MGRGRQPGRNRNLRGLPRTLFFRSNGARLPRAHDRRSHQQTAAPLQRRLGAPSPCGAAPPPCGTEPSPRLTPRAAAQVSLQQMPADYKGLYKAATIAMVRALVPASLAREKRAALSWGIQAGLTLQAGLSAPGHLDSVVGFFPQPVV
jgi:hypothetical protein